MRGPVSTGEHVHKTEADTFLIKSRIAPGTKLKPINLDKTCWQQHPGFCVSLHSSEAHIATRVCCNLNNIFTGMKKWDAVGRLVRFHIEVHWNQNSRQEAIMLDALV